MTVKQLILGVSVGGVVLGLLAYRWPENCSLLRSGSKFQLAKPKKLPESQIAKARHSTRTRRA